MTMVISPQLTGPAEPCLSALFRTNRRSILATYSLFCFENLLRMIQPFVLGLAIDDLLSQSYRGTGLLALQHLSWLLMGTARQVCDTRVFSAIYADLASRLVTQQRHQDIDISRVIARSSMSRSYVEFFEQHLPLILGAMWSVVGALLMLAVYDWHLVLWCVGLILPTVLLNLSYARQTQILSHDLHDHLEREVGVLRSGSQTAVETYYRSVGACRIHLSDVKAINFSLMELFVLGLMIATLVQYCTLNEVHAGEGFAVFRYVLLFVTGMDSVPKTVAQLSRLKDVHTRIRG